MRSAYEDLDVDELVDLLRQAKVKLREVVLGTIVNEDFILSINKLINKINNTLPKIYLIEETRTIKYEMEIEASSEEAALNAYRYEGYHFDREEVDDDSVYEVHAR